MATFRFEEPKSFLGPIVIFCDNKIKKLPFPLLFEADSLILFTVNRHKRHQPVTSVHYPLSSTAQYDGDV